MNITSSHLLVALGVTLLGGACSSDRATTGTDTGAGGASSATSSSSSSGGADAVPQGLPCDVGTFLAAKCTSCHSAPPRSNAPQPLLTRSDFLATSEIDPALTVGERAVIRMRAGTMPVGGGAEADADVLEAWLAAGAPEGSCEIDDPFDTPSVCESGRYWTSHEDGEDMNPGQSCETCHGEERAEGEDAPRLVIGGTVYPNGHAPDDCYGIDGSAPPFANIEVWITDATGRTYELDVRRTGNFVMEEAESFTPPYTAKVVDLSTDPPKERPMIEEQTNGDCNLCHTEAGYGDDSDAPGRVLVP